MKRKTLFKTLLCVLIIMIGAAIGIYYAKKNESETVSQEKDTEAATTSETPSETQSDIQSDQPEEFPEVELKEQTEAEYGKWLASAMLIGLSIEYPEFELEGIYSETTADGVYILFENSGKKMAVHGAPIEKERKEAGTIDISSSNMGLAAFDVVDSADVKIDELKEYPVEDLEETMNQTVQFMMYRH